MAKSAVYKKNSQTTTTKKKFSTTNQAVDIVFAENLNKTLF